jgi:hypothetical protein
MSHEAGGTNTASSGAHRTASEDYLWISCRGCGGEVGVPSNWDDPGVACPSCGLTVQVHGRVLYRPPVSGSPMTPSARQPPTTTVLPRPPQPGPGLELCGAADWAMAWGILSVLLGWTVMVPLLGLNYYLMPYGSLVLKVVLGNEGGE